MGIEDQIAEELNRGVSPVDLIRKGYKKSTVYKVANTLATMATPTVQPMWGVTHWSTTQQRYLPGDNVLLRFTIENHGLSDLYIARAGIQPEWLAARSQWHSLEARKLLHPRERANFAVQFSIPHDVPLGERDLLFGIEGQYVGPGAPIAPTGIFWSSPSSLSVQHPVRYKAFISHSVPDMYFIRQLASHLDDYGIAPIIASYDQPLPPARVIQQISHADLFISLLTGHVADSAPVLREVQYAMDMDKPRILLKDARWSQVPGFEQWTNHFTPVDMDQGPQHIFEALMGAVQQLQKRKPETSTLAWLAVAGILTLLIAAASTARKE